MCRCFTLEIPEHELNNIRNKFVNLNWFFLIYKNNKGTQRYNKANVLRIYLYIIVINQFVNRQNNHIQYR